MSLTKPKIFHGWFVVAAVSLLLALNAGLTFYNLPVLLNAFVVERSFSVTVSSGATSVFFILSGIGGLLAGQLVDRFDIRAVVIGGATLNALTFASLGMVHQPHQLYFFLPSWGSATPAADWYQPPR
jgi:MFS family permease